MLDVNGDLKSVHASFKKGFMENLKPFLADPQRLGQRLRQARELRDLTQQAVATRMKMVRTTLVNIEKGTRRVSEQELRDFLELYEVTADSLFSEHNADASFAVAFRTLDGKVTPATSEASFELLTASAEVAQLARDFRSLEERCRLRMPEPEIPTYPVRGVASVHAAEEVAAAERIRLGLGDGPLPGLQDLLESEVGLRVCRLPMPAHISGGFAASEGLGDWIVVNAALSPDLGNRSLGFAFGHLIHDRYTSAADSGLPAEPDDRFIHAFADAFLMPAAGLGRRFNRLVRAAAGRLTVALLCELADSYRLPLRMVVERLEAIHRLRAGTWAAIGNNRVAGRDGTAALPTLPRHYVFLAVTAFLELELNITELAEKLRTDTASALEVVHRFANRPVDAGPDLLLLDCRREIDIR